MDGALISSFTTIFPSGTALAYDPLDNTLWMMIIPSSGVFGQFSTSGGLPIQTFATGDGLNYLGGEFGPVPEPSTVALTGSALAVMACMRMLRRKRD